MLQSIAVQPERDGVSMLAPFSNLPPFLRALLVADGTVTRMLTAFFAEPIHVRTQNQAPQVMPSSLPQLALNQGDDAFVRTVELRGSESGVCYATAVSVLNPAYLDAALFRELIDEHVGMGEVLRNSARGSYRELLDIRQQKAEQISRTYAVVLAGHPAILITENFEKSSFS